MQTQRVALIDGGGANIASLRFALDRLGFESELTHDPDVIRGASHVILPGVGAARDAMTRLRNAGLDRVIPELQQPVLGICLGLQLLLEASEEDDAECLGVLPGVARRFQSAVDRPVPHMGWNQVTRVYKHGNDGDALLQDVPDGTHFYFVHSYALDTGPATIGEADYGRPFAAVVAQDNFMATQFHPERSGTCGAALLRNFLTRC
jgi:glutamine amidotransferase